MILKDVIKEYLIDNNLVISKAVIKVTNEDCDFSFISHVSAPITTKSRDIDAFLNMLDIKINNTLSEEHLIIILLSNDVLTLQIAVSKRSLNIGFFKDMVGLN